MKSEKGTYLIGEILNEEKHSWDSVTVLAIFKDERGEAVYLDEIMIFDLRPDEKRPFQMDSCCDGISLNSVKFAEYEIKIETASARPWIKK